MEGELWIYEAWLARHRAVPLLEGQGRREEASELRRQADAWAAEHGVTYH